MASAAAADLSGFTLVPTERLRALEALEAELPTLLEKAKQDRDKQRLAILHEKAKEDPKRESERALQRYYNNKEEINARRREKYRQKKEAMAATGGAGSA